MCVLHGRAEYAVKHGFLCINVCVCVCLSGSLWDTVRRELCWLVRGPGGQKGNNTISFPPHPPLCYSLTFSQSTPLLSPLHPLHPSLFLALSQRDEVRLGRRNISGMASGHRHAAVSASAAYGLANVITVPLFQLGNSQRRQWCDVSIRKQNVINERVGVCSNAFVHGFDFVHQCRSGYEKLFQLTN